MKTRSYQLELLDADFIPTQDLYQNLKELAFINKYLGGHATIFKGIKQFDTKRPLKILEIGSGGGDNVGAIQRQYPHFELSGLDIKPDCIAYAQAQYKNIKWIPQKYQEYQPTSQPDIVFNSLFCHHFTDIELVKLFKWMYQNSAQGFVIGDLHRHWLAHWLIKNLSGVFSKSYLLKNDAPLSVKRGFTKNELMVLLEKAGIVNFSIKWCWAFRYLIVVKK